MAPLRRRRGTRSGFTLFEVMAAVIVLGMLYSVLATSAIQGLRAEGESKRRMNASLLVDEVMLELEASLAAGVSPPLGVMEEETDDYRIVTEVTPFDLTPFLGEEIDEETLSASMLIPSETGEEGLLRIMRVIVFWDEAEGEHQVERATLSYDTEAVAALLPAEPGGEAPDPLEDLTEEDLMNPDGTANLDAMLERIRKMSGQ